MKKLLVIAALFLLLFTACSPKTIQVVDTMEAPVVEEPAVEEMPDMLEGTNGESKFKITAQEGIRSPPVVNGLVKNIGNGTGDVKVTVKIYFAGVIADQNSVVVENIRPTEEKPFTIPIKEKTQWSGFTVVFEKIN